MTEPPKFPEVQPSDYAQAAHGDVFVHYDQFPQSIYETYKQVNFKTVEPFNGQPLLSSFQTLCDEFDNYKPDSALLNNFATYVKSHIQPEVYRFLATFWPPIIPAKSTDHDFMAPFLIKILHQIKNPQNLLNWLATRVFPPTFTKGVNNPFFAITRCKSKKKPGFWAVYTQEKDFIFYSFKGNEMKQEFKGKVDKIELAKDKVTVNVTANKKVVAAFVPDDAKQTELWVKLNPANESGTDEVVPFHLQLTSFDTPAIDEFYQALYSSVVNADSIFLRACLDPSISKPNAQIARSIIKSFFHMYAYGNKAISCLCTTFASELTKPGINVAEFLSGQSHSKNLLNAVFHTYGETYVTGFIAKLCDFIEQAGPIGIGTPDVDVAAASKLIINVVKYICRSFELVPLPIKQALNIFRSYVSIATNSKLLIYKSVADTFLIGYLVDVLMNIKSHLTSVKNPELIQSVARLLYVIFSYGKLEGEYSPLSPLQKRLEKHTYPLLFEFALTISESYPNAEFSVPEGSVLARSIEDVARAVSGVYDKFVESYNHVTKDGSFSVIGANTACILTNYFCHECDTEPPAEEVSEKSSSSSSSSSSSKKKKEEKEAEEKKEEKEAEEKKEEAPPSPKKHKYVKADQFDDLTGKNVKTIQRIDPNQEKDPNKKYYKRVHKHVPKEEK